MNYKRNEERDENDKYSHYKTTDLYKAGYSVAKGGPTKEARRSLLVRLMESGKMDYFEIVGIIENDISMNVKKKNRERAVAEWESDLNFLHSYIRKYALYLR